MRSMIRRVLALVVCGLVVAGVAAAAECARSRRRRLGACPGRLGLRASGRSWSRRRAAHPPRRRYAGREADRDRLPGRELQDSDRRCRGGQSAGAASSPRTTSAVATLLARELERDYFEASAAAHWPPVRARRAHVSGQRDGRRPRREGDDRRSDCGRAVGRPLRLTRSAPPSNEGNPRHFTHEATVATVETTRAGAGSRPETSGRTHCDVSRRSSSACS